MLVLFVISAHVAVAATLLAVTARVTLHALLYLAVSLIAVAMVFFALGAPFVAALEVIVYAGAIVVLFIFAVMLLSPGESETGVGGIRLTRHWLGPVVLASVLLAEIVYVIVGAPGQTGVQTVPAEQVGVALFGPYALGIELAAMLLLVALIGVSHIAGRRQKGRREGRQAGAGAITPRLPQADPTAGAQPGPAVGIPATDAGAAAPTAPAGPPATAGAAGGTVRP